MTAQPARSSLLLESLLSPSSRLSRSSSPVTGSVTAPVTDTVTPGVTDGVTQVGQPVAREGAFCRLRMHRMCVSAWCDCACHVKVAA